MNATIISLDELKTMLKIADNSQDVYLTIMIQSVEDYVRANCQMDESDLFADGLKLFAYKFIEFTMQSDNTLLSGYKEGNVQFNYTNELPASISAMLNPYIKVRFSYDK